MPLGFCSDYQFTLYELQKGDLYPKLLSPPQEYNEPLLKKVNDINMSADMLLLHTGTK